MQESSNSNNGDGPTDTGATSALSVAGDGEGEAYEGGGDSTCSTPFVSAPSSPTRDPFAGGGGGGFFFSAPASPTRGFSISGELDLGEFDFSARFPPAKAAAAAMSSADELFLNGQIRPMRLSSLLLRPQALPPLLDLAADEAPPPCPPAPVPEEEAEAARGRLRSRSLHRKSRSLSPLRNPPLHWIGTSDVGGSPEPDPEAAGEGGPGEASSSVPASASRSSSSSSSSSTSSSRSSRKWLFLKDLLHRSKSDGGGAGKEPPLGLRSGGDAAAASKERPFGPFFFSKDKSKPPQPSPPPSSPSPVRKQRPPAGRRRSAHERLYAARRAEAEEMRRRTFLPYRQGLLGCLGFSSRGYGAINGLTRGLNAAVSYRS